MDIRKLQRAIVDGLEDVKGQHIAVFNTEHLSSMFERVIIASGTSNRQTKALAASVRDAVRQRGMQVMSTEGEDNGEWIIVDCGAAVAHIMQPAIRDYYHLEEIWGGKSVRMKVGEVSTKLVKASEPEPLPPRSVRAASAPAVAGKKTGTRASKGSTAGAKQAAAKKSENRTAAFKRVAAKPGARSAGRAASAPSPTRTAARPAKSASTEVDVRDLKNSSAGRPAPTVGAARTSRPATPATPAKPAVPAKTAKPARVARTAEIAKTAGSRSAAKPAKKAVPARKSPVRS